MTDLLLLFPGQGSQKPGMAKDLVAAFPAALAVWDEVDAALGVSLSRLAFDGPAEELTLTHQAQPALLAHGAAVWASVRDQIGTRVRAAAGHSLGEFTAFHAAGALPLADAARLVRRRGELMLEAGNARPGAMAAILGELGQPIDELCSEASAAAQPIPLSAPKVVRSALIQSPSLYVMMGSVLKLIFRSGVASVTMSMWFWMITVS